MEGMENSKETGPKASEMFSIDRSEFDRLQVSPQLAGCAELTDREPN